MQYFMGTSIACDSGNSEYKNIVYFTCWDYARYVKFMWVIFAFGVMFGPQLMGIVYHYITKTMMEGDGSYF